MDDPNKLDSVATYLTNTGFLYHFGVNRYLTKLYKVPLFIYSAKGACMLAKRSTLDTVLVDKKVFDERFFAYFEETDLCHRVWLANKKIIYVPEAVIFHKMGATNKQIDNGLIQFHSYKNRINAIIKNFSFSYLFPLLFFHIFLCLALSMYYVLNGKYSISVAIIKAIMWNVLNTKTTLRKRSYIQRYIRRKVDKEFFKDINYSPPISYYKHIFQGLINFKDDPRILDRKKYE
jgi:GT2 family glycosyltransferase